MGLSSELISQFAKVVNDNKKQNSETTVYGKIVEDGNEKYFQPDGSDQLIPITENADENKTVGSTTVNVNAGDRASVLIKDHTATVTGNISAPAVSNNDVETEINKFDIAVGDQIQANKGYFKELIADKADMGSLVAAIISVAELIAKDAEIDNLIAENATITNLIATKIDADIVESKFAKFEELEVKDAEILNLVAKKASIEDLTVIDGKIEKLKSDKIDANVVEANYAKITDLEATNINVGTLSADVADINTLMFGSAVGNTLQTTFANAVIALLGDAQIKSAMIKDLDVSKINAGTLNTDKFKMESEDGKLVIFENTIQIYDDNRVRVQIGKDGSNDYSINIWDADGNLMFSEGGITDKAIKEAIIRNDMVSDDANIDAKKLDISSLFTEINGSTETIKSSKIYLDSKEQVLDVAFKEMSDTVTDQGTVLTSLGGRNLLLYTKDLPIGTDRICSFNSYTYPFEDTGDGLKLSFSNNSNISYKIPLAKEGCVDNNETVTLSFEYRGNITSAGHFYFLQKETPNLGILCTLALTPNETEWNHFVWTFSMPEANIRTNKEILLFYGLHDYGSDKWIEIRKGSLKLEKGNKATDWTPAPEEVDAKLTEHEQQLTAQGSEISIMKDAITSKVWKDDITEATKDFVTTTEQNTKYSELEQNLDGFKTTVSETYSTKTEVNDLQEDVESEVNALKSRVDTAETNISQTKEAIELRATKTEVTTAINNLEIGGRNLLLKSDTLYTNDDYIVASYVPSTPLIEGEEYTISMCVTPATDVTRYSLIVSQGYENLAQLYVTGTDKQILSKTFTAQYYSGKTPDDDIQNAYAKIYRSPYEDTDVGISTIHWIKIEKGNKATDWTPAPEDVDSKLTDVIDNIEIGGRNLLRFTEKMPVVANHTIETGIGPFAQGTLENTVEGLKLTFDENGKGSMSVPLAYYGAVDNNETVTLSFDYRGNTNRFGQAYFLQETSDNVSIPNFPAPIVSEDEWVHYEYTFSHENANIRVCRAFMLFYNPGANNANAWVEIKKGSLKLEKGNKATDWTPAPEDMASTADVLTISSSVAALTTTATEIVGRVESVETRTADSESNITIIQKDVTTLKTRADSVEIGIKSITDNGVTKVDTGMGFKFDIEGMTVDKTDSDGNRIGETNTKITENGMTVNSNITENTVLTANKDGVNALNLHAREYLIVGKDGGRSRFEDYDLIKDTKTEKRTACFWIG